MPRHCSAGGCKSRDNRETRNAGITFHKLPKGELRRKLWITNSHRDDSWDPQTDFVYFCSKHFSPESFELTGCSGIRRLKEDTFPTIFDPLPSPKIRRRKILQKQEDFSVRKDSHSGDQEDNHQSDMSQPLEKPIGQRTASVAAAADESGESIRASSQEQSGPEQLLGQDCSSPSSTLSCPMSLSHYMRRLPPPPGLYLSKEHSYAQLCPLLWRRRYNQATESLEKALRQLHAARRRENRLRSTVLRLHGKRLKQALLVSQGGCKSRGTWATGGQKRQGNGESDGEENHTESGGLDRCMDQTEMEAGLTPDTRSCSEEETGYCFYCGRGQVGAQVAYRISVTGKKPSVRKESLMIQRGVESNTWSIAENARGVQIARSEGLSERNVETNILDTKISEALLQTGHVIPAAVSVIDIDDTNLQLISLQQNLLLSDTCDRESDTEGEHSLDMQQHHLFWIQDSAGGKVILMPAEGASQSILKRQEVGDEAQAVLKSDMYPKRDMDEKTESSGGLARAETKCNGEGRDQCSVVNTALIEMREDVREKLKEHLEGFQLQLSSEFLK